MIPIIELQVFYRVKDGGQVQQINEVPTAQNTDAIKLQVARIVNKIKQSGVAEYYYMVVKVRKSTGEFGYRTMIPKTLL